MEVAVLPPWKKKMKMEMRWSRTTYHFGAPCKRSTYQEGMSLIAVEEDDDEDVMIKDCQSFGAPLKRSGDQKGMLPSAVEEEKKKKWRWSRSEAAISFSWCLPPWKETKAVDNEKADHLFIPFHAAVLQYALHHFLLKRPRHGLGLHVHSLR